MKERPILFSAAMVRAILDGRKTQTRRVVKPQPCGHLSPLFPEVRGSVVEFYDAPLADPNHRQTRHLIDEARCCQGKPGDRLWVKETWLSLTYLSKGEFDEGPCYRATGHAANCRIHDHLWRPSIFMPRALSRITVELVAVRVEPLNDISRGDCMAEGCPFPNLAGKTDPRAWFAELWNSINEPGSWDANPWVWVIEFLKVNPANPNNL